MSGGICSFFGMIRVVFGRCLDLMSMVPTPVAVCQCISPSLLIL